MNLEKKRSGPDRPRDLNKTVMLVTPSPDNSDQRPQSKMTDARARRVLFMDHTAQLGGGEIALLHLVCHLDPTRYLPVVVLFRRRPAV